jgi:ferredoxin
MKLQYSLTLFLALAPVTSMAFALNSFTSNMYSLSHNMNDIPKVAPVSTPSSTSKPTATALYSESVVGKEVSPLYYAAAGAPTVDMNKYNIPLERIVNEWTAVIQPKSSMQDEGIFLQTKSDKELFVDTLQYKVTREGGLGLVLTELAGGREDGVGITLIEEVIQGGNAEQSGIIAGDSIIGLTLTQNTSSSSMNVDEETIRVSTECLAYDPTIEALTSLPPASSPEEKIIVTVKRIRRQPKISLKLQYPPELEEPDNTIELFAGENLRRALLTRGIKLNDPLAERFDSGGLGDCGADGTCATCVIGITKGMELLSPIGQQESQILSKKPRWRMACKTVVGHGMTDGKMTIQVSPRQWAGV